MRGRHEYRAVVLGFLAIFLAAMCGPQARAATVPVMDGTSWLAAQPELTTQMQGQGSWRWVICGVTQPPYTGRCPAGDISAFGSYWHLAWAILHPAGRTVFWLDQEGWKYTPELEREHPLYYLRLAGQLAARHHVTLMVAPVLTGSHCLTIRCRRAAQLAEDVYAARYARVVDIQDQWAGAYPATYKRFAAQYATALRKANPRVIILDNLSTDPGGMVVGGTSDTPAQSAAILHQSYENARPYVDGFWLEAPTWLSQGPTAENCQNTGCALVAQAFLSLIGG